MENDTVRYTVARKRGKIARAFFYISIVLGLLFLWGCIYKGFKEGILIFALAVCPFVGLLDWFSSRVKGTCPRCGVEVGRVPDNNGLTCDSCGCRMVFRDMKLWEVTPRTGEIDDSSLPPGMTAEEFAAMKHRFKRQAVVVFIAFGVCGSLFLGLLIWANGLNRPFVIRTLDELQVARGEYYVRKYYSGKAPSYETGLRDPKTGAIVLTASDGFCNISRERWSFVGRPATVWYANGPNRGRMVYQLEVSGRMICWINYVNRRAAEANERKKWTEPLFDIGMLVFFWSMAAFVGYFGRRRKIKGLYGEK